MKIGPSTHNILQELNTKVVTKADRKELLTGGKIKKKNREKDFVV